MSRLLGQAVVIDNRAGASGNIAYQLVAPRAQGRLHAAVFVSAYHVGNPAMFAKLPWDPKDLKSFIAYLKQNPGKVNYASAPTDNG